ncbi:MAG: TlpA family protein disulfide reductase [Planctomycetaceae bacterium]
MLAFRSIGWMIVPLSVACILVGCGDQEPTEMTSIPPNITPTVEAAAIEPLVQLSWDQVRQEVKLNEGKVIVVNVWTTTCAVCLAEYPGFVELTKQYPPDKVAFFDVNCDYDGVPDKPVAYYERQVLEFLQEHPSASRHVALTDAFYPFLKANDFHSTPIVLVYDASGQLSKQFDNHDVYKEEDEFHMLDVGKRVDELLKPSAK